MAEPRAPIIDLVNITKRFPGVLALDSVSVSFSPGEIHAVLGENGAGKSTLMNVLAGELQPDSGTIVYKGKEIAIPNPLAAQRLGLSVVHQELALCSNLSIAENISLSSIAGRSGLSLVRRGRFEEHAREVMTRLGLSGVNPREIVSRLSVAQQQLVEIARAISQESSVLILDEPNSALTIEETEHLFTILRQLRADGVAIIYVSHRLEEVLRIADRITVMRDGRHVDTSLNDGTTIESLITRMVGRSIDHFRRPETVPTLTAPKVDPSVALRLRSIASGHIIHHVDLDVARGEIVGIAGLPDSGKDELVDCIFGMRSYTGQTIVDGRTVVLRSPDIAIRHGLALIPADRRGAGALLVMSVEQNTVAASLKSVSSGGLMRGDRMRKVAQQYVEEFDTRISSLRQKMRTLSGGNQQKVIIGRGLATNPSILLLHEPTRGIDVGAKAEIYRILHNLAAEGKAILIVSSELPELIGHCDRILVMHHGRVTGHFRHDEAEEQPILACAMGQATHLPETPAERAPQQELHA
ncbi:MAG: sugar ABC transporter ATP-binding protein [Chloroflexi bacterium]|nr:sugar ABC transporter ATP-binding protein [Chloroflexota bacterium]